MASYYSTALRYLHLLEKKHLFRRDKNYNYFWRSTIPVINLILDSRDMIKVSKNMHF